MFKDFAFVCQDDEGKVFVPTEDWHESNGGETPATRPFYDSMVLDEDGTYDCGYDVTELGRYSLALYVPMVNKENVDCSPTLGAPRGLYDKDLTNLNGIQMDKVVKSIIRSITVPIGCDTFYLDYFTFQEKTLKSLKTGFFPTKNTLRPRIPLTQMQYEALAVTFNSSESINQNIAARLKEIEDVVTYYPNAEFDIAVFPHRAWFAPSRDTFTLDHVYPFCIINTQSVIEIEYHEQIFTNEDSKR